MAANPTLPVPDDAVFRLIYEEAVRAIDDQRSVLDNMRTRSGIVLSAAAVTTSFFGGLALRDGRPGAFGWTAVLAFFVCGVSGLMILLPRGRWELRVSPAALVAAVEQAPPPIAVVHRDLALYMDDAWEANERRMQLTMVWPLRIAAMALVVEVVAWVLNLAKVG
jgi:hypothetical protein